MTTYEEKHRKMIRDGLTDCTVLLKSNGAFPLKEAGKIAAFGNGVRHTIMGGIGSGEVNTREFVTVEEGLISAGFTITSKEWLGRYDRILAYTKKKFVSNVRENARKHHTLAILESMGASLEEPEYSLPLKGAGDTAIYVLSRNAGEGKDRELKKGDILLTDTEIYDILSLDKKYKHFMLVLNVGGIVDLSPVKDVSNILLLSQLGSDTGHVLADILLGRANPSGKLTATWAAIDQYNKLSEIGERDDTVYADDIYVGYRYFDTEEVEPLFPFGHGLSYTSFCHDYLDVALNREGIEASVLVRNTGKFHGKEVIQLYVSIPAGREGNPYQVLGGFAKTKSLAPGESEELTILCKWEDIASFNTKRAAFVLYSGNYTVRIGNSSRNTKPACYLSLPESVILTKVKNMPNCLVLEHDEVKSFATEDFDAECDFYLVDPELFETREVSYDLKEEIDPRVRKLSDKELALLNVGLHNPHLGSLSVIGNAGKTVAGAAGETTNLLKDKGIGSLVLADGPAGLRLTPLYYEDEKGVHGIGVGMIPASMKEFLPKGVDVLMSLFDGAGFKKKDNIEIREQYAASLPIATALAQSFDLTYARSCGDMVGEEMELFGVDLWLAPALNIQKSIRCGRNFEYYSEDPLVSGLFAAAVTAGVQAHKGRFVTIKHYACNNQEFNRYQNNSVVSERALREIYLKGFGICIREAKPGAVMTSYNLLNGIHTSEDTFLNEDILRAEFGFDGIVMTDWIVMGGNFNKQAKYGGPRADKIAGAGHSLVMPGGGSDVKAILTGLKEKTISRKKLMINASRLLKLMD